MKKAGRKRGKARMTELKHEQREVLRGPEFEAQWRAEVERLGAPPDDPDRAFEWLARVLCWSIHSALRDEGLPAEQRRIQVAQLAPQTVKALEPAKLSLELAEIREALEAVKRARAAQYQLNTAPQ